MVGSEWWVVHGGQWVVGGTWWAVGNDFFARDCIQNDTFNVRSLMVECFVFVNVILVNNVVVVVYVVNDGGSE